MRRIHGTLRSYGIYIKGIVERIVLANDMSLGIVITPCIEIEILTAGEVVLLIDLHPFADERLFLRRQQEGTFGPVRVIFWPCELRSDNGTGTNLRSEIIASVGQLHMVAIISELRRHSGIRFAFHTHLTGRHRVRSHSLVNLRHEEIVDRTAARAYLNDCIRLHSACLVINLTEIRRHLLRSIPRAFQTRRFVIIRHTAVEVLTIDFETIEIPSAEEHIEQIFRISISYGVHRREIPTVPPCDILIGPFLGLEQHLRVLFENLCARVSSQRRPPQFGFQAALMALVRDMTHIFVSTREKFVGIPVAFGNLITIVYIDPCETEFRHFIERTQHHAHLKRTSVAPCAPNRLKSLRLRRLHLHAFVSLHIIGEDTESIEIVALMAQAESLEALERVALRQLYRLRQVITQRHGDLVIIALPLHGHGNHTEHGLEQTDSHTAVALPEVHHRNTASVIGVIHTEVVLLSETLLHRQHPVHTRVGRRRLERPNDAILCLYLRAAQLIGLYRHRLTFINEVSLDNLQSIHTFYGRDGLMLHHLDAIRFIRERRHLRFRADETLRLWLRASGHTQDRCAQRQKIKDIFHTLI